MLCICDFYPVLHLNIHFCSSGAKLGEVYLAIFGMQETDRLSVFPGKRKKGPEEKSQGLFTNGLSLCDCVCFCHLSCLSIYSLGLLGTMPSVTTEEGQGRHGYLEEFG